MPGKRGSQKLLKAGLVASLKAGIVERIQEAFALIGCQRKHGAIQQNIAGPLLAAAKHELGATDTFGSSSLINQLALFAAGTQLENLIAAHRPLAAVTTL
jgi:hypothetical protein